MRWNVDSVADREGDESVWRLDESVRASERRDFLFDGDWLGTGDGDGADGPRKEASQLMMSTDAKLCLLHRLPRHCDTGVVPSLGKLVSKIQEDCNTISQPSTVTRFTVTDIVRLLVSTLSSLRNA